MGYFATREGVRSEHPIDLDAELAHRTGWSVKSVEDNVVELVTEGEWRTYVLTAAWINAKAAFQISGGFELKAPARRLEAAHKAVRLYNEGLQFGSFTYDGEFARFRYALALCPSEGPPPMSLGWLVDLAVEACDRLYPALRVTASTDRSPESAVKVATMEPMGSA